MPSLGSQARSTVRGEKNPHVEFDAPLETRAYAIWYAVRFGKVRAHGVSTPGPRLERHPEIESQPGWEVEINLTTKARDLWPELSQIDRQIQTTWLGDLRTYLRATGNMICTRLPGIGGGDQGQPLWWVRDKWNDVKVIGTYRSLEPTYTESRLSRAEAGEDRKPEPVSITNGKSAVKVPLQDNLLQEDRERVLIEMIKTSKEPVYQQELITWTNWNQIEVGRLLRKLCEEERLFRRQEEADERPEKAGGRYRYLYWHQREIPARQNPLEPLDRTIMRINALKPGDSLATSWMTAGPLREVRALVEAGILEFIDKGTDKERIRLADAKPAPVSAPPQIAEEAAQPAVTLDTLHENQARQDAGRVRAAAFSRAVEDLLNAEIEARTGGVVARFNKQAQELIDERKARHRAETALIEARTELSEARRELASLRERFDVVRRAFSD